MLPPTKSLSLLVVTFFLLSATPPPANALIEDVLDVIHVVKEVTVGVLKAWDIVQQSQMVKNIEFPLMREKQRKVLQRLKEMSRQIDQTEQKYAQNVALAVESISVFIHQNLPLMTKMNDIQDTMNRISSRFQQMQKYEAYKDKLEESTLIGFAEWTVSPNAHSVHHLMDRLNLMLYGPEEKENISTTNFLHSLATTYEAQSKLQIPDLQVDATRREFFALEESLWRYMEKDGISKSSQLRKVFDSTRNYINDHIQNNFEVGRYDILNHYEWSLLERDLLQIDSIFGYYKNFINEHNNISELNERAVLDICESVLRNDNTFSMSRIFQDVELVMVKQTLYYRAMLESTDQICHTQQSAQQFVYSLYTDVALTELKGYTMMQFSWMMLKIYGKGNFSQEVELARMEYEKRTGRSLKLLREVMRRADRILWRCDPNKFVQGQNYDEVTRLLQGYIENEVDLNKEETCRETCDFYQSTRSEGCFKDLYCSRQPRCSGKLYHCTFVDSDMSVCPASRNSTRRYEYIEYENGRVLGERSTCVRGTTKVDSWWRYLFWHCSYCFCLCDEISIKSDRYFNLRETVADVENNKVVTGLRFVKHNRIFHLQIQEGKLLPRGNINRTSLTWKPVENYQIFDRDVRNGRDYHTLSYESRSMDLDDIYTDDNSFVVVGVRFRVVGAHLNVEAKLAEFDFKTGKLISPESNSFWKSNDNTDVSGERRQKITLNNSDKSTRTIIKSIPDSRHNQYIDFINTSMDKDAAQSTVPFIDIQEVISNPPVPLSGLGIYHKGQRGYGGFLAPKIMTYDFTPHIRVPQTIN